MSCKGCAFDNKKYPTGCEALIQRYHNNCPFRKIVFDRIKMREDIRRYSGDKAANKVL